MLDLRWLTELLDSIENGIRTTKGADLRAIYKDNDKRYPSQGRHRRYLDEARLRLGGLKSLQGSPIIRPHMLASMTLAALHLRHKISAFTPLFKVERTQNTNFDRYVETLRLLARAIEQKEDRGALASVVLASTEGTNVKKARQIRFKYFCKVFSS